MFDTKHSLQEGWKILFTFVLTCFRLEHRVLPPPTTSSKNKKIRFDLTPPCKTKKMLTQGCIFHGIHGPNCTEGIHVFPEENHHFNSKLILRLEYIPQWHRVDTFVNNEQHPPLFTNVSTLCHCAPYSSL